MFGNGSFLDKTIREYPYPLGERIRGRSKKRTCNMRDIKNWSLEDLNKGRTRREKTMLKDLTSWHEASDKKVKYIQFMIESNKIEGEDRINPGDLKAVEEILALKLTPHLFDILKIHKILGSYLDEPWVGKFRSCNVRVGTYVAPDWGVVPHLMDNYILELPQMDSWEAHNRFEAIHPFQDLNGRVGRLIWLSKAMREGYSFGISFLHMYYYQTLSRT